MRSKREIEREYKKLLTDVATKDFYKVDLTNRVNCYVCTKCHRITKTIDVDAGVTPFIHTCGHCGSDAHSTFYKDIAPHFKPTQEWYRPTLEQVLKMKGGLLDHILQGGLDVRTIK
jgi:RNase P subunit RPR2